MAEKRESRELDNRESEKRTSHWKAPEVLPEPTPQKGFGFRWVRVSSMGDIDAGNVSSKLREGWVPCKATEHPEIFLASIEQERFKDNIVISGLMLCKAPVEMIEERSAYYNNQAKSQMESVDNNLMRENDSRMPLFNERQSKVSFGNGN
jgi:hypothetical protein|tara:strand:- start:710 stop:1159 length:450 start_codon:yes stop_codon:yes gene_type:complete